MVIKEACFIEYVFEGKRNSWVSITCGKGKNALDLHIQYDHRLSSETGFTLFMKGKKVLFNRCDEFDTVHGHIENQHIIFNVNGSFNPVALQEGGKYMKWGERYPNQ